MQVTELEKKFNEMVLAVKNDTINFNPTNAQKLKLYAFYKQVTVGDVVGECTSVMHLVERAKWQAWNAIKGMSKEKAMDGYLKIFS